MPIGGSVSTYRTIALTTPLEDLIDGLSDDGILAKLDRLWVFAQATQGDALTDLIASASATAVNSPSFAANAGFTSDGSSSYIDSNFVPSTDGIQYIQNTASMHVWSTTSRAAASGPTIMGVNLTNISLIALRESGNVFFGEINDSDFSFGPTNTDSSGFFTANRSSSTQREAYRNGASLGTSGVTTAGAVPTGNIFILARNTGGAPSNWETVQCAAAAIGGSFNTTQALNFYNRMRTYMTAVGVP